MPSECLRQRHGDNYSLLRYASLNMQYPRSAQALGILISDIINHDNVEIIQCIEQMAPIPESQYCSLGTKNSKLDDNLHLGDKIKDRMGKFRISITELDMKSFNQLLPDTQKFKELLKAIGLYITQSLDWEMQLSLKDNEYEAIKLGCKEESKLGLNSWLGENKEHQKLRTLVLDKNQYKDLKW